MDILPIDIRRVILSQLDEIDLFRLCLTCRKLNLFCNDPNTIKTIVSVCYPGAIIDDSKNLSNVLGHLVTTPYEMLDKSFTISKIHVPFADLLLIHVISRFPKESTPTITRNGQVITLPTPTTIVGNGPILIRLKRATNVHEPGIRITSAETKIVNEVMMKVLPITKSRNVYPTVYVTREIEYGGHPRLLVTLHWPVNYAIPRLGQYCESEIYTVDARDGTYQRIKTLRDGYAKGVFEP